MSNPVSEAPVKVGPDTPASPSVFNPTRNSEAEKQINDADDATFAKMFGIEELTGHAAPGEAAAAVPPEEGVVVAADADQPRNEKGQFVAKEGEAEAEAAVEVVEPAAEAAEPEPPAKEPYNLATPFVVKDDEGEIDAEDTSRRLKLSFKANGKEHVDVSLDRVVRLAQMGVYNEEREQHVVQSRQEVETAKRTVQEYENKLKELEQFYDAVATDDDFVVRFREQYARQRSPEARLERMERERQQERETQALAVEQQQRAAFGQTHVLPAIARMLEQYPTVSEEELVGRYMTITAPLMERGVVPMSRFDDVRRLVEQELPVWAEGRHNSRAAQAKDTQTKNEQKVTAEKTKTAMAKRTLARAVAPQAGQAPGIREAPKPKTFKSAQQAADEFDPFSPIAGVDT